MKKLLARLRHHSPSVILTMFGLFAAFGGTAVAAGNALITSNQIKNNSCAKTTLAAVPNQCPDLREQGRGRKPS